MADLNAFDLKPAPVPTGALGLNRARESMRDVAHFDLDGIPVIARIGGDSLWLFVDARYALRTAYADGGVELKSSEVGPDKAVFECDTAFGRQIVEAGVGADGVIRVRVTLTPDAPLLLQHWPRDLYPVDTAGDPLGARGEVKAGQRGLNAAVVLLTRYDGAGSALYFQNLTALNAYFRATRTKPDGVVGGRWPELGYLPPVAPHFEGAENNPLKGGRSYIMSDARLVLRDRPLDGEATAAEAFLEMLGAVLRTIGQPHVHARDWAAKARETLRDLKRDPRLTVRHYGHVYLRPYIGAAQPDSMVQLAVARPMMLVPEARELAERLIAGMTRFQDKKLGAIRRFLPNVVKQSEAEGDPKDPDEVDSWYLYHPLANLGALALDGNALARRLLLDSVDYGIHVAHHFNYRWPVMYDVETLEVTTGPRKDGEPGQSDVGGLYADVMLKAWKLTGERRFFEEAAAAVRGMADLRFDLTYQTNLTARGLVPCLELWRETGDRFFLDQSLVLAASFFHNTLFWESDIDAAAHYSVFLGATCLHDGPYMAIFECFESFEGFRDWLKQGGDDLPPGARRIAEAYCKHAINRAWFYYPAELPVDVPSREAKMGELDRKLAIPMEDLYGDGQPPGQIGQEVYGCGAAFVFAEHLKAIESR